MKKPTKKQLYEIVEEYQKNLIKKQEETERIFTEKAMLYYDGAYMFLTNKLRGSFGCAFCLIRLDHIDAAGFWFPFEFIHDKRRQTYHVNHEEAKGAEA